MAIIIGVLDWPGVASAASLPENRYLLVVETSLATANRVDGICQALEDAFSSRMKGQLHAGDTLGVWTFNEDLYTGKFPLESWSPEKEKAITAAVVKHLRQQRYAKEPLLEKIMPPLRQVIRDSEFITVILVTSGQSPIKGTPFDKAINEIYNDWMKQQQQARMPMLTVLQGTKGRITDYRISASPFPIDLPCLPAELDPGAVAKKPASPAPAPLEEANPQPPPPVGKPLIFSGKKPATTPAPTAPPPAEASPAPMAVRVKAAPAPATGTNQIVASVQPSATPGTTNTAPSPIVTTEPLTPALTNSPHVAAQEPAPATNVTTAAIALPTAAGPTNTPPAPTAPPPTRPSALAPQPLSAAAPNPSPVATPVPASAVQAPAAPPPPVAPAPAAPFRALPVRKFIYFSGAILLLALAAIVWVALRSSKRSHHHVSLITESMGPGES